MIGGGNTAVEEALYLSNIASHVTLVHRRDKLRSEKILQDRLFERERAGVVEIVWNHNVQDVLGDDSGVTGVRLAADRGRRHARPEGGRRVHRRRATRRTRRSSRASST